MIRLSDLDVGRDAGLREHCSYHAPATGDRPLAGLRGSRAAERFRAWTGRSGRRCIFSVFPAGTAIEDLPIEAGAVALGVRRAAAAGTELLWCAAIDPAGGLPATEGHLTVDIHLHLLASDAAERAAIVADLLDCDGQAHAVSSPSGASMKPPDWRCQRSA